MKSAIVAVLFSFVMRVFNLLSTALIVRICVSSVGIEQYGVLASLIAVTSFFALGDFGLGSVLMTKLSFSSSTKDIDGSVRLVSNTYAACLGIAAVFSVLSVVALLVLHGSGTAGDNLLLIGVVLVAASVNIPLSLSSRILFGLQNNLSAQISMTAGRFATVIGVWLASLAQSGVQGFAISLILAPVFVSLITTVYVFGRFREIMPQAGVVSRTRLTAQLKDGIGMAVLQLAPFVDIGIDALVAIRFFSAAQTAELDIAGKLYLYIPALISVAVMPLWPIMSAAFARGDRAVYGTIVKLSYLGSIGISLVGAAILLAFYPLITKLWLGREVAVSLTILLSFSVIAIGMSVGSVQSITMNARDVVKQQIPLALSSLAIIASLKVLAGWAGYIDGIPLSTAIVYPIRLLVFHYFITRRVGPTFAGEAKPVAS